MYGNFNYHYYFWSNIPIYFIHSFIQLYFLLVRALYLFDVMAMEVERKGRPQIWFINLFSLQPFNVFLIFRYNVLALLSIFDTFLSIFSVVLFVPFFFVFLVTRLCNTRYAYWWGVTDFYMLYVAVSSVSVQ